MGEYSKFPVWANVRDFPSFLATSDKFTLSLLSLFREVWSPAYRTIVLAVLGTLASVTSELNYVRATATLIPMVRVL